MATLGDVLEGHGYVLPSRLTGHIGGEPIPESDLAVQLPIYYPGSGDALFELQEDGVDVVAAAASCARETFESGVWSGLPVVERQRIFRAIAGLIREHADLLALEECLCAGLPSSHLASRQVPRAADNFEFFADYIGVMAGETFQQMAAYQTVVTRQPAGVAALFAPWNAPLALASMQIASAIAFGNTCVLKPSEFTPLSMLRLVALIEKGGCPPGVVNLVNGRGEITGNALAESAHVARIAFTGGGVTARKVMSAAAQNLTPVHFELGGKSANIIFEDADLDRAIDGSLVNIFSNSGQICIAGSRILVQRTVADLFIEQFVSRTKALRVGDPMDTSTEVGPMTFAAHRDRVLSSIERAKAEGAELLCGGSAVSGTTGYFVEPTVFRVDSNALSICQEEVFGPVVTIQVFDNDDEAIEIANDSRFGLVGYCWTESLARAQTFQSAIDAGTLWINTPLARDLRAPFGGFKESGIGRDGPRQAAEFFTEEKATISALGKPPIRRMGLGDH